PGPISSPGPGQSTTDPRREYMSTSTTVTPGLTFRPRATLNTDVESHPFVIIELDGDPSRVAYFIYTTEEAEAFIRAGLGALDTPRPDDYEGPPDPPPPGQDPPSRAGDNGGAS